LGGKAFNHTAPVIKLSADASESQHLVLLSQLNSSTACFWLKQVCQSKGIGGRGSAGVNPESWEYFYQFGGTKLESFPLFSTADPKLESFARHLDALGRERIADSPRSALDTHSGSGAPALQAALTLRRDRDLSRLYRMVGLQEELDWLCYKLYGLDPDAEIRDPEHTPPLTPGLRPFEITEAQRLEEEGGDVSPEMEGKTDWFERHGWTPVTDLAAAIAAAPELTSADLALLSDRLARTAASRDLALIEQPTYKRRWYRPDHASQESEALDLWLADRIEAWARERKEPFTVRQAAGALRADPAVLAVAELSAGRADFDLDTLVAERIRVDSVPGNKHHVFKPEGLIKRRAWEQTWDLQHREDAGKLPLGDDGKPVPIPVPPKYDRGDYLKAESWSLRGKLDVPKERFIAFTEAPPEVADEPLYGWAGWTHRERARALLALDEKAEGAGVKVQDRYGLLYGVWFLLPYVAWESAQAAADFRADVKSLVGEQGVTEEMLEAWAKAWAERKQASGKKPKAAPRRGARKSEAE
jgi:hypothetical protein